MPIALNIVKEEKNNLEMQLKRMRKEIDALPEGSIRIKSIRGHKYAYRQYRDKQSKRMISVAIKKNEDLEKLQNEILRRNYLIKKAKQLSDEIKIIDKTLRIMQR